MSTVTIHIDEDRAFEILEERGWHVQPEKDEHGQAFVSYVRPGGATRGEGGTFPEDFLWELDEALTEAIVQPVLLPDDSPMPNQRDLYDKGADLAYAFYNHVEDPSVIPEYRAWAALFGEEDVDDED